MRKRFICQTMPIIFLLFQFSNCSVAESPNPTDPNRYLTTVRTFADNVLKYGRDTYGPKHTPLFVDGLNIHTHEPVKWIDPDGTRWILSNLSSQQDLFRTLDGLTTITGDPGYKRAAMDAIRYAFMNLRSPNGLLHWGGHQAYDATNDRPRGRQIHELKGFYPYYELMWEVDPEATKRFVEAFWSGHIINWTTLEMNRHSNMNRPLEKPWDYEYRGGPVFLQSNGHSFFNTGSDLIYAGAILSHLSTEKEPLVWAQRLARRYVDTRHPETGISYWMYTKPPGNRSDFHDAVLQKLMPGAAPLLPGDFPWYVYTNPVQRKFYRSYCMPTPAIPVNTQIFHWQCLLLLGEVLGDKGDEFKQWALEELTAFGKASYRKRDNVFIPILTDGTNIEGYVVRENGPLGPSGVTLEPLSLGPSDLWSYAMAFRVTKNPFMWEMARDIALGNDFGDIGVAPEDKPKLRVRPACSNPYALLAFLELHRGTGKDEYRKVARSIADNVLANRFHKGYFTASKRHIYAKFNAVDSLALLHLQAALSGRTSEIPEVWPSTSFLDLPYRLKEAVSENRMIYTLTESTEPPKSLQEVAAEGDLQAVRSMIRHGTPADQMEDGFKKTALHHAAIEGHKDVVELLLNSGADVNTEDSFPGATPLHYAAENGHKEIAGLLIANGADLMARRGYPAGDTPLYSAARNGHKETIDLLISKGANVNSRNYQGETPLDVVGTQNRKEVVELLLNKGAKVSSLHTAISLKALPEMKRLLEKGSDVNAKDQDGMTPLHLATQIGYEEGVELLIFRGADTNARNGKGETPLHLAIRNRNVQVAEQLIDILVANGADLNVEDDSGSTVLDNAALGYAPRRVFEFLVSKGAEVNSIQLAAYQGDLDHVNRFLKKGVNVNTKTTPYQLAPLDYAVRGGSVGVVRLLISKGANVNSVAKDMSSLAYALMFQQMAIAEFLLHSGASPDLHGRGTGMPILHMAIHGGDTGLINLIIEKGADVNTKDRRGRTALDLAKKSNKQDIVGLLKKHGAKE